MPKFALCLSIRHFIRMKQHESHRLVFVKFYILDFYLNFVHILNLIKNGQERHTVYIETYVYLFNFYV
jgi:hypothetical protein